MQRSFMIDVGAKPTLSTLEDALSELREALAGQLAMPEDADDTIIEVELVPQTVFGMPGTTKVRVVLTATHEDE